MKYYKIKVVEGSGVLNKYLARFIEGALSVPTYRKSDFSPVWIPAVVTRERLLEVLNESECFCSVKEKEKEDEFFPARFVEACNEIHLAHIRSEKIARGSNFEDDGKSGREEP